MQEYQIQNRLQILIMMVYNTSYLGLAQIFHFGFPKQSYNLNTQGKYRYPPPLTHSLGTATQFQLGSFHSETIAPYPTRDVPHCTRKADIMICALSICHIGYCRNHNLTCTYNWCKSQNSYSYASVDN